MKSTLLGVVAGLVITIASALIRTAPTGQGCIRDSQITTGCVILQTPTQIGWPYYYNQADPSGKLQLSGLEPVAFIEDWIAWSAASWIVLWLGRSFLKRKGRDD